MNKIYNRLYLFNKGILLLWKIAFGKKEETTHLNLEKHEKSAIMASESVFQSMSIRYNGNLRHKNSRFV